MPASSPLDDLRERLQVEMERARIIENAIAEFEASGRECTECGRRIGETGRWYADGTGSLLPYCKACAEIEFPVL